MSLLLAGSAHTQAGAMDEEQFMQAFEEVKRVSIFNGRALSDEVAKVRTILEKSSNDGKVSTVSAPELLHSKRGPSSKCGYKPFHSW